MSREVIYRSQVLRDIKNKRNLEYENSNLRKTNSLLRKEIKRLEEKIEELEVSL